MDGCLFCRIIAGEIPATRVYEDEELIAIEDISPVAPLHLLLIPRKHLVNTLDLKPEDDGLMGRLCRAAATIARQKGVAEDGYRLVVNNNLRAGQSVFHLHMHLLAGRDFIWPPG